MKLAFTTTFDSNNIIKWSGTPFYMANALEKQDIIIERIGNLNRYLSTSFKLKQIWKKWIFNQRESPRFNIMAAKHYSMQVTKKLMSSQNMDALIAPQINPIAYLDCALPLILWTDSLYANLINFYPSFANHSQNSVRQGHTLVRECLSRLRLAIFSSDWAADTALNVYGMPKEKIKVVPFGANIHTQFTLTDLQTTFNQRSKKTITLLFLGKDWQRKGGEIVLKTALALHANGESVEVHIIGCHPPSSLKLPKFIHCHGFISKQSPEGQEKMSALFRKAHFLFVPSRAEAYGIVFCEANAFGVPCLTTSVGGIPTIVKNNINGMTFALDTPIDQYCQYITDLMHHYHRYEDLAFSSFNEYQTRLNWNVATKKVKNLISEMIV